jgi:peptide/nickel transport system substrate-binding protein
MTRSLTTELLTHVMPPLGVLDERATLQPLAARAIMDAGLTLDFRLHARRWEDGTPVTARDFLATIDLLRAPRVPTPERVRVERLREAITLDDSTLRWVPWTPYARRIRDALVAPLPAHRVAGAPPESITTWPVTQRPLSCGPFRVAASSPHRVVLVRNEGSGWPPPFADSVVVRAFEYDDAARAFVRGDLDLLDAWPVERLDALRGRKQARVVAVTGRSYAFMGWNLRRAGCADAAVRRAAARAVDIARIQRERWRDQADPARGPLVAALDYTDTTRVFAFDPEAARRELEAAGWRDPDGDGIRGRDGVRLTFQLIVPHDEMLREQMARDVARDLRVVGIGIEVRALSLPEFAARLASADFDAFMGQWAPDLGLDLVPVWHSTSTHLRNFVAYSDSVTDQLLMRMQHELGAGERARVLAAFQRRVYDAQPYLFLVQSPRLVVLAPRLRGVEPNALSTFWNLPAWWIPSREQRLPRARAAGMMPPARSEG